MALINEEDLKRRDALYERYGKPLEAEHWGEFVAIAPDGRTMVGTDMEDTSDKALKEFGCGVHLFKVGPVAVGRLRSPVKAKMVCTSSCAELRDQHAFYDVDALYERYGKPLEAEHWGKVLAIATDGRTLLGTDVYEVEDEAPDVLHDCYILFKVGLMSVGRI